ncbi:MAG: suppressor of fused domain protein [Lachnospiraceae bacterium]|nr:suppressor of fused domain protein [Lachnospiraceae bacterium]
MENETVIEDWSPVSDIQAIVEKTEKNYYFYFWINPGGEGSEIRSCWICNRVKAPETVEEALAVEGEAPCMPAEYVDHDPDGIELDEESLSIQWFEEGNAAALLSGDRILAVIPNFSGYKGFHGYSIYAKGTGDFAWELKQAYPRFEEEIKNSRRFWEFFDQEDFWGQVQDFHLKTLNEFFGKEEKYYAIDGGEFPPKALVQGRKGNLLYAFTLGVSMIPMPNVDMTYEDYNDYRRMELGFACNERHEPLLKPFASTMSWLAAYPWKDLTFFGHGHTIPFRNIKGIDYILFLNDRLLGGIESPAYKEFMGETINLLWLVPITQKDQEFIVENGIDEYLKDKDVSKMHILE